MAAPKYAISRASENRPYVDTGWRVGMPVGSNPPRTTPIQTHRQAVQGAIDKNGVRPILMVSLSGYGVLGR